jgi:DNA polymerase III psi subunit
MNDFYFDLPNKLSEIQSDKKILIVIKKNDSKVENIDLIKNILKSLSKSLDDVQLEIIEAPILLGQALNHFEKIIAFGMGPESLSINSNYKPYAVLKFEGTQVIFANTLADLSTNVEYKKILWQSLQQMFK